MYGNGQLSGQLDAWKDQILDAVIAYIEDQATTTLDNTQQAFIDMQTESDLADAAVNSLYDKIVDIYTFATSEQTIFNTFKQEFTSGVMNDMLNVAGCYGKTKRSSARSIRVTSVRERLKEPSSGGSWMSLPGSRQRFQGWNDRSENRAQH